MIFLARRMSNCGRVIPPPFLHPPRSTMIFKLDFMHTITIQQHYDERGGRERGDWADGSRHRYTLYLLLLFERI